MQRKCEVLQSYKVNFKLTFLKADNPTPSELTRSMAIWEPVAEDKLSEHFQKELQRSIAGINEFPLEDVAIEIVSIRRVPVCS